VISYVVYLPCSALPGLYCLGHTTLPCSVCREAANI
jgi:hypothetical protein